MSVRKRTWVTRFGEQRESWIVDYVDQHNKRHIRTFERKKDADEYHAKVRVDVRAGVHTAPSTSITVSEAAADWLRHVELEGRERATVANYRQHVNLHIEPRLGREKLAKLTTPRINKLRDDLLADVTRTTAKKVLTSLKSLLKDAQRRGNVAQNVARDISIGIDKRDRRKLRVGVDIPTVDEVRRILAAASGRVRPLLVTAALTGLRASELRGLRWEDVDLLRRGELHVRQRADHYNAIGRPKSHAGERTVPLSPMALNTLKEWKLVCPRGDLGLVFPTTKGRVEHHSNIVRALKPVVVAAGVVDETGKPKYTGLHALRHFYASWCINRRRDGGLELPPKTVQARLGHSSIVMTLDRYGHLFPSGDESAEMADAEHAIFAT
jgi:integrase